MVFDRLAEGEVAPKRTIDAVNTTFVQPIGVTLMP
jgi:hypothetical protein